MLNNEEEQNLGIGSGVTRRDALRLIGLGAVALALDACGAPTSAATSPNMPSASSSLPAGATSGPGVSADEAQNIADKAAAKALADSQQSFQDKSANPTPSTSTEKGGNASSSPAASPASADQVCSIISAASKSGDQWVLKHPDENQNINMKLPDGFTPDKALYGATDIKALALDSNWSAYADWEVALNTKRPGGPLAGYNYDYNDWCPTENFQCNMQADLYGWRTLQGMVVAAPGIGRLQGGERRSVVLNILNLDGSVHAWDDLGNGQVCMVRGFTATGRIFDGSKNVDVLEKNLSEHWLSTQASGEPSKSYIGITGVPDNALETLLVSVQRKQWGLNSDGSKRMEFQLIRAELVKLK